MASLRTKARKLPCWFDVIGALNAEADIVRDAATRVREGRALTDKQAQRLSIAVARLVHANDVVGGAE